MMFKASDLPDGVKRQLLDDLRNKVGYSAVDRMVAKHGEDGLINVMLQAVEAMGSARSTGSSYSRPESGWKKGFKGVLGFLASFGGMTVLFAVIGALGWVGAALFGIVILIIVSKDWVYQIGPWNAAGTVLGGICVLALIGVVGVVLWFALPWIGSGIWQWWTWLGGHFA